MRCILTITICVFYASIARGQKKNVIDSQFLANGTCIQLTTNGSGNENQRYAIEIINRLTNDTIVHFIDSIQHAHCSPPNSIFFINDSIGFFTESGGCYASYNWLFRTEDSGVTWKFIRSGSRTDGHSFHMLHNESFYMFDDRRGIIIWEMRNGALVYSVCSDGGLTWTGKTSRIWVKKSPMKIQHISFSADGQVTIICGEKFMYESERKGVVILQSNNFGKSFRLVK
jgi:hypothetical protein